MRKVMAWVGVSIGLWACGASTTPHGKHAVCPHAMEHHGKHHGGPHGSPHGPPIPGHQGEPGGSSGTHAHHGHASHRFDDAEAWAQRFEDPSRDTWQKPERVLAAMELKPDSIVADIGAASGYFPVRIAAKVSQGRVWGVDIEPAMVRYLNARARREKISNLYSVLAVEKDPLLPEACDVVLLVNTYHHIGDRPAYFDALRQSLTRAGRLVIVDFKLGKAPVGPPDSMKIPPDQIVHELASAGYRLVQRDDDALPYQHILVFSPTANEGTPADEN